MEAEIITSFLPDLVTAVNDCVQSVSDQCLAKGLIPDAVYKRVLESVATSEDKARTLVLAVKKSTETDKRCFELFMNILEQELPFYSREKLISDIRKEHTEKVTVNTCRAIAVPSHTASVQPLAIALPSHTASVQPLAIALDTSGESVKHHNSLLGRLEDAIRQHERACSEKMALEKSVEAKERENQTLKAELESLKTNQSVDHGSESLEQLQGTESRLLACEVEISKLKSKIEELQSVIEEQGMRVKRGKSTLSLGLMNLCQQARTEITAITREKELCLEEKQEVEDELRAQVQSLEHKVALQEKDLQMKDLELSTHQNQLLQRKRELTSDKDLELPQSKKNALEEGIIILNWRYTLVGRVCFL